MKAFLKSHLLSIAIIISISIYSLWPILQEPVNRIAENWDGVLMVWYLNQTVQKIPNDLPNIFQGNIFHPYENTMAYSDMHILSALTAYFPVKLTGEPAVAISASLLFGQIATIFICYLWFWEATKSKTAALISSLVLGVSLTRMSFNIHLQMWNHQWWLASAYFFWKYFKKKDLKLLIISAFFFGLQMWDGPLGVYFAATLFLIIGIKNLNVVFKDKANIAVFIILSGLIMLPPAYAYFLVSKQFDYVRTIRDAAHFSMGLDTLFKGFFTDGIFIGFFLLTVTFWKKVRSVFLNNLWLVILFFLGIIMSLGPVLKFGGETFKIFNNIFVPLPYGVLYYIIPGFKAFRAPDRWIWLSLFALAFMFSLVLSKALKGKINPRQALLILIITIISLLPIIKRVEYYNFSSLKDYPKVYSYVKNLPEGVLLELPIYSWAHGDVAQIENKRMVYSLYHGKYLLGGIGGCEPPSWNEDRNMYWSKFPGREFDEHIRERGVDYILIWKDLMEAEIFDATISYYGLPEYEDFTHVLYKI